MHVLLWKLGVEPVVSHVMHVVAEPAQVRQLASHAAQVELVPGTRYWLDGQA